MRKNLQLFSLSFHKSEIFTYLCLFKMVDVAQLVRVSVCGTEGRRFEPGLPPISKSKNLALTCEVFLCIKFAWREACPDIALAIVSEAGLPPISKSKNLALTCEVFLCIKFAGREACPEIALEPSDKPPSLFRYSLK